MRKQAVLPKSAISFRETLNIILRLTQSYVTKLGSQYRFSVQYLRILRHQASSPQADLGCLIHRDKVIGTPSVYQLGIHFPRLSIFPLSVPLSRHRIGKAREIYHHRQIMSQGARRSSLGM